jgi:hypothetical protein
MAKLFDDSERLIPTWFNAISHVAKVKEDFNLVLEIEDPIAVTEEDQAVINRIDAALRQSDDSSIQYVANTIFPRQYINRRPRPGVYNEFVDLMENKGKKKGTWGTYAMRMLRRRGVADGDFYYPVDIIIGKLKRASEAGHPYRSAYELGVLDPNDDVFPYEIATYDGKLDAQKISNMPCLSHLTFKMVDRDKVNLTALYRSHYYCSKSLGNLVGLRDLLQFVAKESGLDVGTLTCISSYATFDAKAWGGVAAAKAILSQISDDLDS